jgi:hypothetical protein
VDRATVATLERAALVGDEHPIGRGPLLPLWIAYAGANFLQSPPNRQAATRLAVYRLCRRNSGDRLWTRVATRLMRVSRRSERCTKVAAVICRLVELGAPHAARRETPLTEPSRVSERMIEEENAMRSLQGGPVLALVQIALRCVQL